MASPIRHRRGEGHWRDGAGLNKSKDKGKKAKTNKRRPLAASSATMARRPETGLAFAMVKSIEGRQHRVGEQSAAR